MIVPPALMAALKSLQEWSDQNPEHLEALIGGKHGVCDQPQQAIDHGLNYFGAQLTAESFWRSESTADLESLLLYVRPDHTGQPDLWVLVSRKPVFLIDLAVALQGRTCTWTDDGFCWSSACELEWMFNDRQGPLANDVKFCMGCGARVAERQVDEDPAELPQEASNGQ